MNYLFVYISRGVQTSMEKSIFAESVQLEELFQHFSQFIVLSENLKQEIANRIQPLSIKKETVVHDAHQICGHSYFIQKGLLRTYFHKDGKEISEYFSFEKEWVNSPRSFMQQQIDIYSIDALEDTEAFKINVPDLVYLFNQFPEMERYARLSMGSVFGHFMERITSMRFTTAKEKYNHFLEVYAGVHHRIPLGMIASYMGVTQETLSRIRAEK
ncbi:MAG TPA: Crp/Fnr family transcriptional regulator [Salinimicrobium sp.]|nr:Crp/Fnr family transcriptional regulator [Salinimicrobium sp.]